MTERNLRALAGEYRRLGYVRFVYVNTVSVLEPQMLCRAVGDVGTVVSVLLEATDAVVARRLSSRERGSELTQHVTRGVGTARTLAESAAADVHRLDVSHLTVHDAAVRVLALTRWLPAGPAEDRDAGVSPVGARRSPLRSCGSGRIEP